MKRFIILLIIFCSLLFGAAGLAAERNGRLLTSGEMEEIFREIVLARTTLPRDKLRITDFTARPDRVTLPPGPLGYRLLNPAGADRPGRKTLQVVLLVAGREFDTVRMTAELRLYDLVVCATRNLARHALLTDDDLKVVELDISMLGSGLLTDPGLATGRRLTTAVRPGMVLQARHLEEPPLVSRGDLVTIRARSGQLEVKAPGEARSTGARGELVRVKNLTSRRIIHAMVQGPGLVEVEF
jgi:flagellar basal body P-ring formation protein FlgA